MRYIMLCLLAGLAACSESNKHKTYTLATPLIFMEGLLNITDDIFNTTCLQSEYETGDFYLADNVEGLGTISGVSPDDGNATGVSYTGVYDNTKNGGTCFTGRLFTENDISPTPAKAVLSSCTLARGATLLFTDCSIDNGVLQYSNYQIIKNQITIFSGAIVGGTPA